MKILSVGFWIALIVYAIAIDLTAQFIPGLEGYLSPRKGWQTGKTTTYELKLGVGGHGGITLAIAAILAWFTPRLF